MGRYERENGESDEIEPEESREHEELREAFKRYLDLEKRKKKAMEGVREVIQKYRARLQGTTEKNEDQDTDEKASTPEKSPELSDNERLSQKSKFRELSVRREQQEEEQRGEEKHKELWAEGKLSKKTENIGDAPENKDKKEGRSRETEKESEETRKPEKRESGEATERKVQKTDEEIKKAQSEKGNRQKEFSHEREGREEGRDTQKQLNEFLERKAKEGDAEESRKDKRREPLGEKAAAERDEGLTPKVEDKRIAQREYPRELNIETALETPEKEEKWLETLRYEKSTVLIQGEVFSFSLPSRDVLSKVIEARNKSKPERNNDVLQACNETLQQFHEEEYIDASRLNIIIRYLKKPHRETSLATEAEPVPDTYTLELRKTEELLQLLGAKYTRTPKGLSMLEPLEPYERINIPQKQLEKINEKLSKTETPETIEKLYEELKKKGIPENVEREKLESYLRTGKKVPVDIYLKTCHTLGIEADQSVVTRWRSPTVDIATGKWYSRPDVAVRIQPDDLKNLYEELLSKLESEEISLDRFATILADAGAASARGRDVKEILNKRYLDTITLSEICTFLGKEPSQIRELDQNNMSKEERVYPSRKNIRRIRQEAWKKYGYNYPSELAKDIKISSKGIKHYISDERKTPIEVLEKIEETLGIKISDSLHERIKTRFKDYKREIIREKDGTEATTEKIEINEPKEGKRTILTLIHIKGKDGSITREVKQTGETYSLKPFSIAV